MDSAWWTTNAEWAFVKQANRIVSGSPGIEPERARGGLLIPDSRDAPTDVAEERERLARAVEVIGAMQANRDSFRRLAALLRAEKPMKIEMELRFLPL